MTVLTRTGQTKNSKGFRYEFSGTEQFWRNTAFAASVKENANIWVKKYTNSAAFEMDDYSYGAGGMLGSADIRSQSPNFDLAESQKGELYTAHLTPDGTEVNSINAVSSTPEDVTWDGEYIWQVSATLNRVYKLDEDTGNRIGSITTPNTDPQGLAWDGKYLWNSSSDFIYQISTEDGSVQNSFASSGNITSGLEWTGESLWAVDSASGTLYEYDTSGTVERSFSTPQNNPRGVTWDGVYFWVGDSTSGSRRVDQVEINGNSLNSVSNFSVGNVRGVAWDGVYLWTSNTSTEDIERYSGSASADIAYQFSWFLVEEAIVKAFTETLVLNDDYNRDADFFRDYSDSMTLSDNLSKKLLRDFQETFTLTDTLKKSLFRSLQETVRLTDVYTDQADLFRDYTESFTVQDSDVDFFMDKNLVDSIVLFDADIRRIETLFEESIQIADTYSREADFFRDYNETITLSDFVDAIKIRFLTAQETITLNDTVTRSVDKSLQDVITIADQYADKAQLFRDYQETVRLVDATEQAFLTDFQETVVLSDQFNSTGTFFRDYNDSFLVSDADVTKTVGKVLQDGMTVSDRIAEFRIFKVFNEDLRLNDEVAFKLARSIQEDFKLNDRVQTTAELFRKYSDSFTLSDTFDRAVDFKRDFQESLVLNDFYNKAATFRQTFTETINLNDVFIDRFLEGPGIAPYFANILSQLAGTGNIKTSKDSAQIKPEKAGSGSFSYGDQPQR